MRNAVFPSEIGAARQLEIRHNLAQFGVNATAVITLVVVFRDDFPVCRDLIRNQVARPQVLQRIADRSLHGRTNLRAYALRKGSILQVELHEEKPAPTIQSDGVEGKILSPEGLIVFQKRRAEKFAFQAVRPLVIRAADCAARHHAAVWSNSPTGILRRPAQAGTSMAAYVVMSLQLAALGSDHEHAFSGHLQDTRVAG